MAEVEGPVLGMPDSDPLEEVLPQQMPTSGVPDMSDALPEQFPGT